MRVDNNFSGYDGEINDVRSLVINSKGHYFAGTSGGVFHSTDLGDSWDRIGEWSWVLASNSLDFFFTSAPLRPVKNNNEKWIHIKSNSNISCMAVDSKDYLYIGTEGNGVLRSRKPTTKLFHK